MQGRSKPLNAIFSMKTLIFVPQRPLSFSGPASPAVSTTPRVGSLFSRAADLQLRSNGGQGRGHKEKERVKVDQIRLHEAKTTSSRLKERVSEEVDDLWDDIEANSDDEEGLEDSDEDREGGDPTYELACLRRANQKCEKLSEFVKTGKKMFHLQV